MSATNLRQEIVAAYRLDRLVALLALIRASRLRLILAASVLTLLLAGVVLGFGYAGAETRRAAVAREVEAAEAAAAGADTPALPTDVESTELMSFLLKLARDSSVEVVSVDSRGQQARRVGERDYRTFKYDVRLRARLSQLVAFLNRFEQARLGQPADGAPSTRAVFLETLDARPQPDQTWLVTAELLAFASPASAPAAIATPKP